MADDTLPSQDSSIGSYAVILCLISMPVLYYVLIRPSKKNTVILFTRYPQPGKAKTRLIPELGPEGAAAIQVCMTEHIIETLKELCVQRNDTGVVIQYNGGSLSEMKYWLARKLHHLPCVFKPQSGSELGEKLMLAFQDGFYKGHENVIIIGADIPGITSDILNEAITSLFRADMVIGKAEDGGYYLIGLNRRTSGTIDRLFQRINWGTNTVYQEQVTAAKNLDLSVITLPQILQDVDYAEDIAVFEREVGVSRHILTNYRWSIIIPVLNEEKNIVTSLKSLLNNISSHSSICDIVVCDGGSSDGTCSVVKQFSETSPVPVKLAHSKKGRGLQLIGGAEVACGDYFLFVHADTILPKNFDVVAKQCLQVPGNVAGAFGFQLDVLINKDLHTYFVVYKCYEFGTHKAQEPLHFMVQMYLLQKGAHLRSHHRELPYGDQGLFMSRKTYTEVGGYPYYRLMEDYIMVEKLKTIGHVATSREHFAVTSYRRWRKYGWIRVTGLTQIIIIAYRLGVHPDTLARWYYGDKIKFD